MPLTPEQFVQQWDNASLNERQIAQRHFIDVCQLVGHPLPPPDGRLSNGKKFVFEQSLKKEDGGQGFADVWYEDHFAIEYKGRGKDLDAAYQQLKRYRENLKNPPLLIVCDIEHWRIHTNFPNTENQVYAFSNRDLLQPGKLRWLKNIFEEPNRLHPERNTEQVTAAAAASFQEIVDNMRQQWHAHPERIARFMTKLVFCLFAEDVELLPEGAQGRGGIFSEIVSQTRHDRTNERFIQYLGDLFQAMAAGGDVMYRRIPYFNGALFVDTAVEPLSSAALTKLDAACHLNWSAVEPSIFGTLFERSLDPNKRGQLGAHYTSRADIELIVEPVLMQPLRRAWAAIHEQAVPLRAALDSASTTRDQQTYQKQLADLRGQILQQVRSVTVLDPACGSGNFLYVSLGLLLDLEKAIINDPIWLGLPEETPGVHPRQLYGIEKDEIAHALASIVVWIGYIQWRQNNGYPDFTEPILEDLRGNIVNMDAILALDEQGKPIEPEWQPVDVIVGNPPFLGGSRIRGELGDQYIEKLWQLYEGRVPGFADLVCYWFERARAQIEQGNAHRAGLIATNSIRGGVNREVLKRIKDSGDIFMAWSDNPWTLDGAAVRVSIVGFGGKMPPTLNPSPTAEGGTLTPLPSERSELGEGAGGWGEKVRWEITPDLQKRMMEVARDLRRNQTPSEKTLWQAIRKEALDGRKFRRQMAIGPFVVDFYCPSERLAVEVDGSIHESQRERDAERQQLIESLGIRFVRVTADEVETDISGTLAKIRAAFAPAAQRKTPPTLNPSPTPIWSEGGTLTPLPSERSELGEGAGGWGADFAINNLPILDGKPVTSINADLTATEDITSAKQLKEMKIFPLEAHKKAAHLT